MYSSFNPEISPSKKKQADLFTDPGAIDKNDGDKLKNTETVSDVMN